MEHTPKELGNFPVTNNVGLGMSLSLMYVMVGTSPVHCLSILLLVAESPALDTWRGKPTDYLNFLVTESSKLMHC